MEILDDTTKSTLQSSPAWISDQINQGIAMRMQAKDMQDEAKAIIEKANPLLSMALSAAKLKKVVTDCGTVSLKSGTKTSLNKEKMAELLVLKGADAQVIADAMTEATNKTEYKTVEFRGPKGG